jgi:hypothetical protein
VLTLHFSIILTINALDNTEHIVRIKKWENEKLHEFRGNFNRQAISDLRNKLRDLDASSVTQEQVNIVVNEFGKIHIDSAKETFGTITKSNNRKKKRNTKIQKPWFDLDCKFERQYYRKMKRKHTFRNSNNSRKKRKEDEKKYKMQMDTACLLKLTLNSCNFSFSHFIFTMCSVFSKAFISLSLSSKTLLSKVILSGV